jgi:site-specific DNA recombinase
MNQYHATDIPLDVNSETASNDPKKSVILLRVSSPSQVRTDYDPEGLSLPAQREECERKAKAVGAEVAREYIEPGVSGGDLAKRKIFRQMIADIRERGDIDYVIVWSVSRWARNQEDHWTARGLINRAGAKLISVKEPIGEDTSHGIVVEGVMAAVAAGRRIEISEEVTRGFRRKVEVGGKPGLAPLGYLNVGETLPQGGEVRIIVLDAERAEIIRWGFEAYASGVYSLVDMVALLAARGLRTRGNRRCASKPLGLSAVHRLLSNPFYAGKVLYKGKLYPGRHDELVDGELFEKVQAVLKAHNASGERDRTHLHYLKGTIRCGGCNHRLTYSRNKGKGGTYEYFLCAPSQRGECLHGYRRADAIEAAIEHHYRGITLATTDRERIVSTIEKRLAKLASTSKEETQRCDALLANLKEQERKLLQKHYKDDISDEMFAEEAARIKHERADAKIITDRLNIRYDELSKFIAIALRIASYNLHDLYLRAKPYIRRLMNQAIFEAIWVEDDSQLHSELASPFAELAAIRDNRHRNDAPAQAPETAPTGAEADGNAESPDPWLESEDWDVGSISNKMVGETGFEPATARPPAGCATRLRHSPWPAPILCCRTFARVNRPGAMGTYVRVS